jgi:hypothetical protein
MRNFTGLSGVSLAALMLALVVAGCQSVPPEPTLNPAALTSEGATPTVTSPAWPSYSWRLPKTVLTVTTTYTLTGCSLSANNDIQPVTKTDVTIKASGTPDTYLGAELPDGWITVHAADLASFWSTTAITVETDPSSRMLVHLASSPVNQGPSIIANAITGVTKIAAVVLGAPAAAGGAAQKADCLDAGAMIKELEDSKVSLAALATQTSTKAAAEKNVLSARIAADTSALTISFSCDIDPGITNDSVNPRAGHCPITPDIVAGKDPSKEIPTDGRIAVIALTPEDVGKTKWITKFDPADPKLDLSGQQIGVYLDFGHAYPPEVAKCPESASNCFHHRVDSGRNTMFREVAYIGVSSAIVKQTADGKDWIVDPGKKIISKPVVFPFAQFGIPRTVALVAGFAQSLNWDITLNTLGEMGVDKAGMVATGVGVSSTFGGLAGGASAIRTEVGSSESAVDPVLQGQAAQAQALYNLANARQQLLQLCAKTYMPDVCP